MRQAFWPLFLGVLLACGEKGGSSPSDDGATPRVDGAVVDASTDAAVDSATPASDAGTKDSAVDASNPDAGLAEIAVDRVLPEILPSTNKPTVGAGVAATVPTCATGQFACNGVCIASDVPAAADKNGCKLIDGKFFNLNVRLEGTTAYASGERNEASGRVTGIYQIALDGSATTLLAKMSSPSLRGLHQDKLIVYSEGCAGQSRYTRCLSTLPITGGTPTPLFPGLYDTDLIVAGSKTVYRPREVNGVVPVYERELFDGAPVFRFASNTSGGLAKLISNGAYAYFTRSTSGGHSEHLLTKLGAAGTTVRLADEFTDPYINVFFAGDYLYLVRRIGNDGAHYQRVKLGADSGEALAQLPLLPSGVVVAGDSLYFRAFSDTADRIYRMPLVGGAITPVATFKSGDLAGYAASGNFLYVTLQLGGSMPLVRVALQ
jgi:hypothetical protein